MYTTANVYLNEQKITTDESIFPIESTHTEKLVQFQRSEVQQQNSVGTYSVFCEIFFARSNFSTQAKKSYLKLNQVISYIGGFCQIFFCVSVFLVNKFNTYIFYNELANRLYDFDIKNENVATPLNRIDKLKNPINNKDFLNPRNQKNSIDQAPINVQKTMDQSSINQIKQDNTVYPLQIDKQDKQQNLGLTNNLSCYEDKTLNKNKSILNKLLKNNKNNGDNFIQNKQTLQILETNSPLKTQEDKTQPKRINLKDLIVKQNKDVNEKDKQQFKNSMSCLDNDISLFNENKNTTPLIRILNEDQVNQTQTIINPFQLNEIPYQQNHNSDQQELVNIENIDKCNFQADDASCLKGSLDLNKNINIQNELNNQAPSLTQQKIILNEQNCQNQQQNQDFKANLQNGQTNQGFIHQEIINLNQQTTSNQDHTLQSQQYTDKDLHLQNNEFDQQKIKNFERQNQVKGFSKFTSINQRINIQKITQISKPNQFLENELKKIIDRNRSLYVNFKYIINQLTCGKIFNTPDVQLLNKAFDLVSEDLDIFTILDRQLQLNKIKNLFFNEDQNVLFNFFPKPIIRLNQDNEILNLKQIKEEEHQQNKKLAQTRRKQRRLNIGFKENGILAKVVSKFQKHSDKMSNYEKLYSHYSKLAKQCQEKQVNIIFKNNSQSQINKKLIELLGDEMRKIFEVTDYLQKKQTQKVSEQLQQNENIEMLNKIDDQNQKKEQSQNQIFDKDQEKKNNFTKNQEIQNQIPVLNQQKNDNSIQLIVFEDELNQTNS